MSSFFWLVFFQILFAESDFYGNINQQTLFYPQKLSDEREGSRPLIYSNLNFKSDLSETWKLKSNFYLWLDPTTKASKQKVLLEFPELLVEKNISDSTLQIGMNVFQWGVTEGYDPLSLVNSFIFWNPLSPQKLSSPSITFSTSYRALSLDLVYIPINRTGKFPNQGSRWIPSEYIISRTDSTGVIVLPSEFNYNYASPNELTSALSHNYGFRLRETVGDLDWGLVYFEGAGNFPMLDVFVNVVRVDVIDGTIYSYVSPDLTIVPVVPKMRTVGVSLVYNMGDIILRYAGNYQSSLSEYRTLVNWSQGNVFSFEWAMFEGFTLISEYSYISHAKKYDNNVTSAQSLFQNTIALGARYGIGENWSFTGLYLKNLKTSDEMYHIKMARRLWDVFTLEAGWTEINGSNNSQSQLSSYGKNDFAELNIKYHF